MILTTLREESVRPLLGEQLISIRDRRTQEKLHLAPWLAPWGPLTSDFSQWAVVDLNH